MSDNLGNGAVAAEPPAWASTEVADGVADAPIDAAADADRLRASARADAERIRAEAAADALRERGEAYEAAHRLGAEARTDAARVVAEAATEADRLREEAERALSDANDRARQILVQAEAHAQSAREEAARTASRVRDEAEAERQNVLRAARTLAETETARRLADAEAEARRIEEAAFARARQTRSEAELEAQAIRETAELDRIRIVEEARAQAYFEASHIREEGARRARAAVLLVPPTTTPIHSSEITLREFPRAVRGLDPDAVSKWLALVEQSYSLIEDELERRRHDLDDLMAALNEMRRHLSRASGVVETDRLEEELGKARASWNRAVEITTASVPSTRIGFDTLVIRTALMETPLQRRLFGYSRDQVRRLLEASAVQLARLENQLHLTHAENERLRSMFLGQLAELPGPDG